MCRNGDAQQAQLNADFSSRVKLGSFAPGHTRTHQSAQSKPQQQPAAPDPAAQPAPAASDAARASTAQAMGNGPLLPADLGQRDSNPTGAHGLTNGKIKIESWPAAAAGPACVPAGCSTQPAACQAADAGTTDGNPTKEGCRVGAWKDASAGEDSASQPEHDQAASGDGAMGCGLKGRGMSEETSTDSGLPQGVLHSKAPCTAAQGISCLAQQCAEAGDETFHLYNHGTNICNYRNGASMRRGHTHALNCLRGLVRFKQYHLCCRE